MDQVRLLKNLFEVIWRRRCPSACNYNYGKKVYSIEEGNRLLVEGIKTGKPFMACRLGAVEINMLADLEAHKLGLKPFLNKNRWNALNNNAGFFPNDIHYAKAFGERYFQLMPEADLVAVWYNEFEDYLIRKYSNRAELTELCALEPWYTSEKPWTEALQDKKVLVIHPFSDTIRSQYEKREKLFPGTNILPNIELKTIKAVQTMADQVDDRFSNWFEALDYMHEETKKIDYNVAIIGCGAYGLPLAAMIKQDGKIAIHMGGATQLLFGIKGKRWDKHPEISKLFNDSWVRPGEKEQFDSQKLIENGCYW